jgi:hypothetical protein
MNEKELVASKHSCTGGLGCCNPHGDCPQCGCAGKIERLSQELAAEKEHTRKYAAQFENERLRAALAEHKMLCPACEKQFLPPTPTAPPCTWRGGCKEPAACAAAGCCQQITISAPETSVSLEPPPMRLLEGPIEVGQRFIWEPHSPRAWAHIEVTRVQEKPDDERRIWVKTLRGNGSTGETWNDESRFREACVRAPVETAVCTHGAMSPELCRVCTPGESR